MKNYTLNELSLPFADKWAAQQNIEHFITTCGDCRNKLKFGDLLIHENLGKDLYHWLLAENYAVYDWLKEANNSDTDLFLDITATSPLITDADTQSELWSWSEFNSQKQKANGLGAAYLLDTLAVSFASHTDWDSNEVEIKHNYIDESGNEKDELCKVKHASTVEHVKVHEAYFNKPRLNSLESGNELWERREEFFPDLVLCGEVQKQLKTIGFSKELQQINDRLTRLNEYAKQWKTGSFNEADAESFGLVISGESETTRNDKKLYRLRRFRLSNNKSEYFDLHVKTGNLRFHFYPDNNTQTIYVGYIGKHLPT